MRVALATCEEFAQLDPDDALLPPALAAIGIEGVPAVWTQQHDWSQFDAVIVRNTWDYIDDVEGFRAWTRAVEAVTTLLNPADVIAWNTDKVYLRELAEQGVPVVQTEFIGAGYDVAGWQAPEAREFVVKPTVSCGSRDTIRYSADAPLDQARAHIERVVSDGRTIMVQPYLEAVDSVGETALLFFNGEFSHAIRKGPLLQLDVEGEMVGGLFVQEQIDPRTASEKELAVARRVLDCIPGGVGRTLHARVDLIPDADGNPVLLELELTEPSVFLRYSDGAADRLAAAIASKLAS